MTMQTELHRVFAQYNYDYYHQRVLARFWFDDRFWIRWGLVKYYARPDESKSHPGKISVLIDKKYGRVAGRLHYCHHGDILEVEVHKNSVYRRGCDGCGMNPATRFDRHDQGDVPLCETCAKGENAGEP